MHARFGNKSNEQVHMLTLCRLIASLQVVRFFSVEWVYLVEVVDRMPRWFSVGVHGVGYHLQVICRSAPDVSLGRLEYQVQNPLLSNLPPTLMEAYSGKLWAGKSYKRRQLS